MYLLNDGRQHGHLLGDLYDKTFDIQDFTEKVQKHMLTPIRDNEVSLYSTAVLGLPGAGKTTLCLYFAYLICMHYGMDNVQLIYADDLTVVYDKIGKEVNGKGEVKKVVVFIIPDASTYLSSLKGDNRQEVVNDYFRIRHIYEENSGCMTGKIFSFLDWQRMKNVLPRFRNPDLWAFLSSMADGGDIREVETRIGERAYDVLSDHWDKVQGGRSELKSDAVVRLSAKDVIGGVGMFHGKYYPVECPDWQPPDFIRAKAYFTRANKLTLEEALDKIAQNSDNKRNLDWYLSSREYKADGKTIVAIAAESERSPSTVWEGIASIRKLLAAEGITV